MFCFENKSALGVCLSVCAHAYAISLEDVGLQIQTQMLFGSDPVPVTVLELGHFSLFYVSPVVG